MDKFFSKIYHKVVSSLFKGSIFKEYNELYRKGAYGEAYTVLRDIVDNHPKWSKKGDPYVTLAELKLLSSNDTDDAMKFLEKANELGCKNMATYYGILGTVFLRKDNYKKGIQYFEKSVEVKPYIVNLTYLGEALSSQNDKRAISIWKRILKEYPKDCIAHAYLAMEAEKVGDKEKALLMFDKAEEYASTKDDIYELGGTYYNLNKFQKALKFFLKCEEMDYKTQGPLFGGIAYCYLHLDDFKSAIFYASKALDINYNDDYAKNTLLECTESQINASILHDLVEKHPETCFSYILHAQHDFNNSDSSKVYEFLSKAIQLKPSDLEMYYIGRLFHFSKHYEKAITIYLECEKLAYPYLSHLYSNIAKCYGALEDQNSTVQYSVKSLELDFNNDEILEVLLHLTREKEIGANLDRFLKKNPESSLAYIIYAQQALRQNNISKTLELVAEAQRLKPSLIEMFYIAYIYCDLEDYRKALDIFLECEKPEFENKRGLYLSLANCYYELEEFESSIFYAEKVLSIDPNDNDAKEVIYACREGK